METWITPAGVSLDEVPNFAGFVYQIVNIKTGRAYIGRKYTQVRLNGKMKSSNWPRYFGSSKALKAEIEREGKASYRREILSLHTTRQSADYEEVRLQFALDVLNTKLSDGSRAYYNNAIAARWFRAPASHTETTRRKMSETAKRRSPETKRNAMKAFRDTLKLSEQAVREIRASTEPLKVLAERYGVSEPTISKTRRRLMYPFDD